MRQLSLADHRLTTAVVCVAIIIIIIILHVSSTAQALKKQVFWQIWCWSLLELHLSPPHWRGSEDAQMVVPQIHVTPNLHTSALTLSPPTRGSINLIAGAGSGTLATDKWVSSAARVPVRRVHVCVRAR